MEYWSAKHDLWILARVKSFRVDEHGIPVCYNLDCKMGATPERIRRLGRPRKRTAAGRGGGALAAAAVAAAARKAADAKPFVEGDAVRYYSTTGSRWVRSTVKSVNRGSDGVVLSYNLDTKVQAELWRVRHADTVSTAPAPKEPAKKRKAEVLTGAQIHFEVGQVLEYYSKNEGQWLVAVVQKRRQVDDHLVYDLRCRKLLIKGAGPDRLRAADPTAAAAAATATNAARAARKHFPLTQAAARRLAAGAAAARGRVGTSGAGGAGGAGGSGVGGSAIGVGGAQASDAGSALPAPRGAGGAGRGDKELMPPPPAPRRSLRDNLLAAAAAQAVLPL